MLYTSERSFGCRFTEVTLYGLRTLIIENKFLHTMILIDKGCDIIELNYKPEDVDFIWKNPMGLSCLKKMQGIASDSDILSDNYAGGWFEILPNVGGACSFRGKNFSAHSEVSNLPWEYTVVCDTPQKLSICFFTKLSKYPFRLEKTITILEDSPSLFMEEELTNLGCTPLEYQWGHHPNIGGPFLDEHCVIELPACKTQNYSNGRQSLYPLSVDDDGREIDISKMPKRGSMKNYLVNLSGFSIGCASVRNTKTHLGIKFSWDKDIFSSCALWISANHDTGHHHHDGAYVMCFLPKNTDTFSLDKAFEKNELPVLSGGGCVKTWFKAEILNKDVYS